MTYKLNNEKENSLFSQISTIPYCTMQLTKMDDFAGTFYEICKTRSTVLSILSPSRLTTK